MVETCNLVFTRTDYGESEGQYSASSTAVIVPTFNRPKLLKQCLSALSRQDACKYAIIVVDDGSYPRFVRSVHQAVSGVKLRNGATISLYRCVKNRGPGEARATGVEQALDMGKRILIEVDDDDIVEPECVRRVTDALERHEAVYTNHQVKVLGKDKIVLVEKPQYEPGIFRFGNYAYGVRGYRAEIWERLGKPESEYAEDYEFFIKMDKAGVDIALIPEILTTIRINPNGRSNLEYTEVVQSSVNLVKEYYGDEGQKGI